MEIRGRSGLARAMRDYRRLCADERSGAYNRISAVAMIAEQIEHTPRCYGILQVLAAERSPVSSGYINHVLGTHTTRQSLPTSLLTLTGYELVDRTWQTPPGQWLYVLSSLGQMVMERIQESSRG